MGSGNQHSVSPLASLEETDEFMYRRAGGADVTRRESLGAACLCPFKRAGFDLLLRPKVPAIHSPVSTYKFTLSP